MSLAITFPGQGSQSIGMLAQLADGYPIVKTTFDEASAVAGFDLWGLIQNGPEEELNRTENTQPALLSAGVACWRVWQEAGGPGPVFFAGHSLGEYTALVCADTLQFNDAVGLVLERARFMQAAVPEGEGAMAAVLGLDDDKVVEICQALCGEQLVSAANFNSPGQVVIAGHTGIVNRAVEELKATGARRAVILPVSVPSHCGLMQVAADKLSARLDDVDFFDARVPVIQNVDAQPKTNAMEIKDALLKQLYQPVQWSETVLKMKAEGVKKIIECGPGKVLTGLNRRIDKGLQSGSVFDTDSLHDALSAEMA